MEDRFLQQLKKGVLEMLVLELICEQATYGYALLSQLKARSAGRFVLKEGTLYPILYRLEDDGFIAAKWSQGEGRTAPKKMYEATETGRKEALRRRGQWAEFQRTVSGFYGKETENDGCGKENEKIYPGCGAAAESAGKDQSPGHE